MQVTVLSSVLQEAEDSRVTLLTSARCRAGQAAPKWDWGVDEGGGTREKTL